MNRGKYNRYLTVIRPAESASGPYKEVTQTEAIVGNVWGRRLTPSAKEVRDGEHLQDDHLVYEVRNFDVTHNDIIEDQNKRMEVLTVTERDDNHILVKVRRITR